MKRKLFAFSMTVALLMSMLAVANVGAHTIVIENKVAKAPDRRDWFGVKPPASIGAVMRNNAQQGEFVFGDALKIGGASDARQYVAATDPVTRAANLDFFSVTADFSNVYFLAKVDRYNGITQSPAINLIITIDTDHTNNSGRADVPVGTGTFSTTNVPADAAWESAINAQFRPGNGTTAGVVNANKLLIFDNANPLGKNCTSCAGQLVSAAISKGSFVELSIPWTALTGVKPTANTANFLRFTVATTYNGGNGAAPVPADGNGSPIIDVLSTSTSQNTLQELADGTIDSSFDVHFNTNAAVGTQPNYEPYAPLQITEFQANPPGKDDPACSGSSTPCTDSEWIEIYNPNNFQVPLTDYKIGNAATRGSSSQGMFRLGSGSLASKALLIVARSKTKFLAAHPGYAGTVLDLNALSSYNPWATGTIDLDNIGGLAVEEQIVLIDAKDDIVDMVTYGNPTTPSAGVIPIRVADVPESTSYERCPSGLDTNGGFIDGGLNDPTNNTDFIVKTLANQTPGQICTGRVGLDESIAKRGPETATVGTDIAFELTYSNIGSADEIGGVQTTITDTLPVGMSFKEASFDGTPVTPVVNGQNVVFKVAPPVNGGAPYTIVLTATIAANAPENTALTNRATISSPNEPKDATTQSNNQSEWTVTTLGPALLDVKFNPVLFAAPPGRNFAFTLQYGNNGQSVADGVDLALTVPAGVTITGAVSGSASPTFNLPVSGPTTIHWTVDQLDALEAGAITVSGTVLPTTPEGTSLQFGATLSTTTSGVSSASGTGTLKAEFIKIYLPITRK